jgi:hypothetical protein
VVVLVVAVAVLVAVIPGRVVVRVAVAEVLVTAAEAVLADILVLVAVLEVTPALAVLVAVVVIVAVILAPVVAEVRACCLDKVPVAAPLHLVLAAKAVHADPMVPMEAQHLSRAVAVAHTLPPQGVLVDSPVAVAVPDVLAVMQTVRAALFALFGPEPHVLIHLQTQDRRKIAGVINDFIYTN